MSTATILVVDDQESIRFTFNTFLTEAGYQVVLADSHDQAVGILKQRRFDLVFADILLGGKTGLDLLRYLRGQPHACPVILITGSPEVDTAAEAVRLGAYDYIPKPITRDILLRVCRMALAVHRLREQSNRYRMNLEAIFESVKDGILTVDRELNILAANHQANDLFCLPRIAAGGAAGALAQARCSACLETLKRCLDQRQAVEVERVNCPLESQRRQVLSLTATPLVDALGEHAGAVLVMRDETRIDALERNLGERTQLQNLAGKSAAMQKVFSLVEVLKDVDTTVLITGESGTGKELVAEALHLAGARRNGPLVKVNCSALTEGLLESELFGHVKGAFTGAVQDKVGRFQRADGGTLFLDEIGDISAAMQVRLLRVLQEKEFERVGDARPIRVDVRVVAATNRNLAAKVQAGEFREDLYYRLKVVVIDLPPLRRRLDDLPLLVEQFIARFNRKLNRTVRGVGDEVMRAFYRYSWPGNVRELEHAIEHAFILSRGTQIETTHLPAEILADHAPGPAHSGGEAVSANEILLALEQAGGNKAKAARLLGISRRTLYRRLEGLP